MRCLAIDPGFDRCGVAIMDDLVVITSRCIETDRCLSFAKRLLAVASGVEADIAAHRPEVMALETLYFSNNQKTALRVAEVRGALLLLAARHGIRVCEYAPRVVKQAVTGNGAADKQAVARMVPLVARVTVRPGMRDDEYDAIAVGIACALLKNGG